MQGVFKIPHMMNYKEKKYVDYIFQKVNNNNAPWFCVCKTIK